MRVEQLSIDIVGLAGACSYALDCIEAELVNVKNKHGKWIWIKYRICWKEFIILMELNLWIMIFHLKEFARNAGRR